MKKALIAIFFAATFATAGQAADLTSVDCTPPKLVLNFASAVTAINIEATSATTTGLTSLKFKKDSSSSETVELAAGNCIFNSAGTSCTMYVTRADYEDTYAWNVWPIAVEATADSDTSTQVCN